MAFLIHLLSCISIILISFNTYYDRVRTFTIPVRSTSANGQPQIDAPLQSQQKRSFNNDEEESSEDEIYLPPVPSGGVDGEQEQ